MFGLVRGFTREAFGLIAWAAAIAGAIELFPIVDPTMRSAISNGQVADAASYALSFIVLLVVCSIIADLVGRAVRATPFGGVDRMLGLVFGLARGAAIVIVAYVLAGLAEPPSLWPTMVRSARATPLAYRGATWAVQLVPPSARPVVRQLDAPPPAAGRGQDDLTGLEVGAMGPLDDDDHPHEECGVFGIWRGSDAAAITALGLHALQHRGQEATGIVSLDGQRFHQHKGLGLVGDNYGDARVIASLPGFAAIGHNRYATTGDTVIRNVQPLYADFEFGGFAVAHNGNLTNALALRRALVRRGCLFQSSTDSEVFVHLIAISLYSTVVDRLIDALKQVVGAYSLVALSSGGADRGARSAGGAAADPGTDPGGGRAGGVGAGERDRARWTSWTRSSCATSIRARS